MNSYNILYYWILNFINSLKTLKIKTIQVKYINLRPCFNIPVIAKDEDL
jgi:hypothetical protein